jgi:hypothetical protein
LHSSSFRSISYINTAEQRFCFICFICFLPYDRFTVSFSLPLLYKHLYSASFLEQTCRHTPTKQICTHHCLLLRWHFYH